MRRALLIGALTLSQRSPQRNSASAFGGVEQPPPGHKPATRGPPTALGSLGRKGDDDASPEASPRILATTSAAWMTAASPLDNYHLIWSPGAWKKMVGTSLVLWVVPRGLPSLSSWSRALRAAPWLSNVVLPLAASSCCLLQLGLNLLSFGCAGWNASLGPVRPYFLGLLFVTTLRSRAAAPATLLWRWGVALLPEVVHVSNTWRQQQQAQAAVTTTDATLAATHYELELEIPTMGCVACIQSIDASLANVPGVLHVTSELLPLGQKGGRATLRVATDDDPTLLTNLLVDAIRQAGFAGASLTSLRSPGTRQEEL
jgi:copper chaperone CopZ